MAWRYDRVTRSWAPDPMTPLFDELWEAIVSKHSGGDYPPVERLEHGYARPDGDVYTYVPATEFVEGLLGREGRVLSLGGVRSQNGYSANDRSVIHTVTVPGTAVKLPVRVGPAGDLLIAAARRWHTEVEPLVPGTCWGYAERTIRGSSTELSNHASGTAIDCNAPKHPMGTAPNSNFTPAQIATIQRIIADAKGALRWGGSYTGRKDGMHVEVVASEAACSAVLNSIPSPAPRKTPMSVMPWTLPPGTDQEQTIPIPVFDQGAEAFLWMVTGWEPAEIEYMYFVRDTGPGKTPQQEQWGGSGEWTLAPDDRPSFSLGKGCTSVAIRYSAGHAIQCLIVHPSL